MRLTNKFWGLVIVIVIVTVAFQSCLCYACLSHERIALLQLKSHFPSSIEMLSSWGLDADCCAWYGVTCDSTTNRVSYLYLWGQDSYNYEMRRDWYLNVSLFLPFQELTYLALSYTKISGYVENGGFEALSKLKNLRYLYLSGNNFNNSILSSLGGLSLKALDLSYNAIKGSINLTELNVLTDLVELDLSGNEITKVEPSEGANGPRNLSALYLNHLVNNRTDELLESLVAFHNLQFLFLDYNNLRGAMFRHQSYSLMDLSLSNCSLDENFLQSLELLPSLKYLYIERLQTGLLTSKGFPRLNNLLRLDLHTYTLNDKIVESIGNLTSLQYLNLKYCGLSGHITQSLCALKDLQELYMSGNDLIGTLPWCMSNLTSLQRLDLSSNKLYGRIPTEIGVHFPRLSFLNMSSNNFSGSIPSSMGNMSSLTVLDFSNNGLSGKLPNRLIKGCRSLEKLKLSNNNLQGQFFPRNASLTKLFWLQLDGNQFTGSIPNSLSESSVLTLLDVSHNNLSGGMPRWITSMSNLQLLDLSHNKIDGILLPELFPPYLSQVYLSYNGLQGSLQNGYDCQEIVVIDFSHNNLTGDIPKWLGRCSKLRYLVLKGNNFKGKIPKQLCKLDQLSLIDLSYNYLSDPIPSCLSVKFSHFVGDLQFLADASDSRPIHLEFTTKNIQYTYIGKVLGYLSGLDLSNNVLVAEIPSEIGNLDIIQVLNMSHNKLVGPISQTFSNLQQIESLDLSYNKLDGNIPPQLTKLHFLAAFSVAHNNLSGRVPDMIAQFATFDNKSYEGNPFLCGPPLSKSCDSTLPSDNSTNCEEKEDDGLIDMDVFYISFGVSFMITLMGIFAILWINPYWRHAWFYFIGKIINNCFYFFVDNIPILSNYRFYQPFT